MHKIKVVNPRRRRTSRKTPKRDSTGRFVKASKKKKATKKRTKSTTTTTTKKKTTRTSNMAKKKRSRRPAARKAPAKRRTSNPSRARRAGRRANRATRSAASGIAADLKGFAPRFLGVLAVSFAVKRFGYDGSLIPGQQSMTSPALGQSWTLKQYLVGYFAGVVASKLLPRIIPGMSGAAIRQGATNFVLTKAVWTEVIARNETAQNWFGADGDVTYDKNTGNMMIEQGGRMNYMQGLVNTSPLDGSRLVETSALDGDSDYSYGHLTVDTPAREKHGKYTGKGYKNPYQSAYASY